MGDLEKIFIGTMILTGLLILFLFGLYFDIGDIVAGTFKGHTPSFGQDLDQIRRARAGSFLDEAPAPRASLPRTSSAPRESRPIDYRRYIVPRPPVSQAVLFDREVRRLQRKGFIDEEYIRMKALYEVDRSLVAALDGFDRHMDAEDYDGAIAALLEALEHIDPGNHLARRDLQRHLYQAYILSGKDAEATRSLSELTLLHEKIVAIEERAELHQDSKSREYTRQMRENMGKLREAVHMLEGNADAQKAVWDVARQAKQGDAIEVDPRFGQAFKATLLANQEVDEKTKQQLLERVRFTGSDQLPQGP